MDAQFVRDLNVPLALKATLAIDAGMVSVHVEDQSHRSQCLLQINAEGSVRLFALNGPIAKALNVEDGCRLRVML